MTVTRAKFLGQKMGGNAEGLLKLDQTVPQKIINGVPTLEASRVINQDNQLVDKKYVDSNGGGYGGILDGGDRMTGNSILDLGQRL